MRFKMTFEAELSRSTACIRDRRGLTLVEVLMAITLLTVALVGVGGAMAIQAGGIASGVTVGQAAVSRGRYLSAAAFLAQDRLEQVKRLQYTIGPPAVDQIGSGTPATALPNEDFGTIAGYAEFRRETSVQNGVPGANMKLVTVTVRFRLPRQTGVAEERILMRTAIAAR